MTTYTEAHRRWYLKNRERLLEERRVYAAQYTAANPDKIAEYRERTAEERRQKDRERYYRKKAERLAALGAMETPVPVLPDPDPLQVQPLTPGGEPGTPEAAPLESPV